MAETAYVLISRITCGAIRISRMHATRECHKLNRSDRRDSQVLAVDPRDPLLRDVARCLECRA